MNSDKSDLCVNCHQFFGSVERKGMCSVCFKKNQNNVSNNTVTNSNENNAPLKSDFKEQEQEKEKEEQPEKVVKPEQTNKFVCWKCETKVGYLGFKCNCGYIFCGKHRHFSEHNCDFDFKAHDRSKMKNYLVTNSVK